MPEPMDADELARTCDVLLAVPGDTPADRAIEAVARALKAALEACDVSPGFSVISREAAAWNAGYEAACKDILRNAIRAANEP